MVDLPEAPCPACGASEAMTLPATIVVAHLGGYRQAGQTFRCLRCLTEFGTTATEAFVLGDKKDSKPSLSVVRPS